VIAVDAALNAAVRLNIHTSDCASALPAHSTATAKSFRMLIAPDLFEREKVTS
jgi:hypothetical protein